MATLALTALVSICGLPRFSEGGLELEFGNRLVSYHI
jgi:hypothetical protein